MVYKKLFWNDPPMPSAAILEGRGMVSLPFLELERALWISDTQGVEMRWPNGKRRITFLDCAKEGKGVMLVGDSCWRRRGSRAASDFQPKNKGF